MKIIRELIVITSLFVFLLTLVLSFHISFDKLIARTGLQRSRLTFKMSVFDTAPETPSVLLELAFPGDRDIDRIKNDMVLSKSIQSIPLRYFLNIVVESQSSPVPAQLLGAYVGDLYSKAWNEAVIKKCLDFNCIVFSDAISGLLTTRDVLQRKDLKKIVTFRPEEYGSIGSCEIVNTKAYTDPIDAGFALNRVIFIDSPFQTNLTTFPLYRYVALGGSFDNLHNGHRKLLMFAAAICSEELTIGVTAESMLVHKSNADFIGSYAERVRSVTNYLADIKPSLLLNITQLEEHYGPAIVDSKLEALVVSSETLQGAFKINDIRREKRMTAMDIIVLNRADAAILSSSFIREQKVIKASASK